MKYIKQAYITYTLYSFCSSYKYAKIVSTIYINNIGTNDTTVNVYLEVCIYRRVKW